MRPPVTPEAKRPTYPPKELSDQAIAWIVRLHSGEAGKADRAAFLAWRRQSADHEAAALEAETLWGDASELHRDPSTGLIRPGRAKGRPSRRAVLGGMAGLAVAGAGALWMSGANRSWRSDHATGVAETRVIRFPDGSLATLNAMTAINVDYRAGRRRIELIEGQAFFEVVEDDTLPFTVDTRGKRVVALGTAFDVDANLPDGSVAVAVTEHSVRVEAGASPAGGSLVVEEGQRVVISQDGRFGGIVPQEAAVATAWRTGMYVAEERRLEDVIAAFRAYHEGWIVVQGERVKALRVNAVLDLRTPDASLRALAEGLPITVRHVSRYLTVITAI